MGINLNKASIKNYLKDSQAMIDVAKAQEIVAARGLLAAVSLMRDELRVLVESKPKRNEADLREDLVFLLGMIAGFNTVLRLPLVAREYIDGLSPGRKES